MAKKKVKRKVKRHTTAQRKKIFIEKFPANLCEVKKTCQQVNISRFAFYEWYKKDEKFKREIEAAREGLIDWAESVLYKRIKQGCVVSVIFFLKCKGKERGWIEKTTVEHQGTVGVKPVHLTQEELQQIAARGKTK